MDPEALALDPTYSTLDPELLELDPVLRGASAPQSTSATTTAYIDPEAMALDPVLRGLPAPQAMVSKSGYSQEPMPGWQSGLEALKDRLSIGGGTLSRATAGWGLATGDGDFETARTRVETQALLEAQSDTEDYRNTHEHWDLLGVKMGGADIPGWLAEQIPQLGVAAGGAAYGAMAGSVFGPGGVGVGALIGSGLAIGGVTAGNHIYDQMGRGVDKNTAVLSGVLVGGITGALETIGLRGFGKAIPDAARAVVKSAGFRDAFIRVTGELIKSTGTEVLTEDLESVAESFSKYVASRTSHGAVPFTWEEAMGDLAQSTVQASIVAGQMGAVTTGGGAAAGSVAKRVAAQLDERRKAYEQEQAGQDVLQTQKSVVEQEVSAVILTEEFKQQKARARKSLKGFVEVGETLDVKTAQQNADSARAVAVANPDAVNQLALAQAEAELKQAQYAAQIAVIEDVLTDPNITETLKDRQQALTEKIGTVKELIADATLASEKGALGSRLSKLQGALRRVGDLQALGSDANIKAQITKQKAVVEKHAADTQLKVAESAINRRMAERERTIDKLRGEIRQAKSNAQADGTGADTAQRRERLEQLREQQSLDEMLLELFVEKIITTEDVADLTPKVPTKRLIGLVEVAKRQLDKAAKVGAKEQKRLMVAAKRLLDAVIDLSRLPTPDKAALKALYATMDLEKLTKALPVLQSKIADLFDKRRTEAARGDLKRQLESIRIDVNTASKTPGTEELLATVKNFAQNDSAVDLLEASLENKDDLTELEEAQIELANLFPQPIKDLNATQLERIIDTIVELRETGKAAALKRIQDRQARQQAKLETLHMRMTPTGRGRARQTESIRNTIRKSLDDKVQSEISSWRGLMTIVTQHGEISDMSDVLDLKSALSEMHRLRIKWENRWKELVNDAGLTDAQWQKFNMKANKRGEKLRYNVVEAGLEKAETLEHVNGKALTLWEMIQVRNYLLDQDPDAISRLSKGNRFSYPMSVMPGRSTLEVVETYLNDSLPNWREVADAQKQFYYEFHAVVDQATFNRFGRHIPMNATYGGELLSSTEPGGRFRDRFRQLSTRPRSMAARQGGNKRVVIRNAMDNLTNHINQYAREVALLEFEQDSQALFSRDQNVRDNIERSIGENTVKVIDKYIEDIVVGFNKSYSTVDKIAAWLRECLYSRFLGARPEQFAKQMTGFIQGLQFVGPDAMADGYAFLLSNPDEAVALMNESALFQARKLQRDPDFKPNATSQLRTFNGLLMKSVEVGDHYGVAGSAFPVLLHVLRTTGDKKAALKAFETAFDTTQSSASVDELPNLFRGAAWARLLSVLAQEPTRQVEAISTARRKWTNNPTKEGFAQYARIVGVTYAGAFMYNMMGYMIAFPFMSGDDAEKKLNYILDVSILGPFAGVAVTGQVFSYIAVSSLKLAFNQNTRAYEPELLASNVLEDITDLYSKLLKLGSEGGDAADYWSAMLMAGNVLGDVTGLPASNILKKIEPFAGVEK